MNRSLTGVALMLFFAVPVLAQKPGGPPPVDRAVNTDRVRQQDMSQREWQLRNFGNEPGGPADQRRLKALMAQTEEDFNRILTLHNEIARALASKNALDYQFVSDATSEIKKRASRVQSSLKLAPEEGYTAEKLEEIGDPEMKDALIKLCHRIRSFVTNPSIENPNTVDAQHLTKARHDLEAMIQLSEQIKKDADRIKKN
jgi:signal transduction histidine kinase